MSDAEMRQLIMIQLNGSTQLSNCMIHLQTCKQIFEWVMVLIIGMIGYCSLITRYILRASNFGDAGSLPGESRCLTSRSHERLAGIHQYVTIISHANRIIVFDITLRFPVYDLIISYSKTIFPYF
jgi:hypothetical protein